MIDKILDKLSLKEKYAAYVVEVILRIACVIMAGGCVMSNVAMPTILQILCICGLIEVIYIMIRTAIKVHNTVQIVIMKNKKAEMYAQMEKEVDKYYEPPKTDE
jgi:hypothetical protein